MSNDEFRPQPQSQSAPARYVPTLTEVVSEAGLPAAGDAPAGAPGAGAAQAGVTAEQVLALLGPELDRRISEAIALALHEQMLGLHARVRRAVAEVVQDAVEGVLSQRGPGSTSG